MSKACEIAVAAMIAMTAMIVMTVVAAMAAMIALMPRLIVLKTTMSGHVPTCQSHEPCSAPATNHHRQVINIITIFISRRSTQSL